MRVTRHASAAALLAEAGGFLEAREAEHNLPLGILLAMREDPGAVAEPAILATVGDAAGVVLVAVRTPPYGVVLSEPAAEAGRLDAAGAALVDDLATTEAAMRSVLGPKASLAAFVDRWCAVTGRTAALETAERIYRLSRVIPARPTTGSWRLGDARDRPLLIAWLHAFHEEALAPGSPMPDPDRYVDRLVGQQDRYAYLWEAGGRPVSLAVASARTPNGRRIGPVYTPPADRGHGYASAVTAAASADQLARGMRFCFLFTDLANPVSNAIYQRIGYEPVSDVDQVRFDPSPA
jgi:RimJ/RimL family protein N-acetyltransferase